MTEQENVKEAAERLIGEVEANLADPSYLFSTESVDDMCRSLQECADKCRAFGTDEMNRIATLLDDTLSEVRERGSDWREPGSPWHG
jgi:hypothetical protein